MWKLRQVLLALLLLLVLASAGATLTACDDQGPAEEAGEEIDDTMDDAGDEIDDTFDD